MCAFPYTLNCTITYTKQSYTKNFSYILLIRHSSHLLILVDFFDHLHHRVDVDNLVDVAYFLCAYAHGVVVLFVLVPIVHILP